MSTRHTVACSESVLGRSSTTTVRRDGEGKRCLLIAPSPGALYDIDQIEDLINALVEVRREILKDAGGERL